MLRFLKVLSVSFLCIFAFAVGLFSIVGSGAAKESDASWIDRPGSGVGGKAVFTDCSQRSASEGRPPVSKYPKLGGGGAPMGKTRRIIIKESFSLAETAAPPSLSQPGGEELPPPVEPPEKEGNSIYLSNDDSMSLSSAQRIEYAIKHFLPIPTAHLRPHEFLNYYKFDGNRVKPGNVFSVKAEMAPGVKRDATTLALSVRGRTVSKNERHPAVMTFVLDQSGSMSSANKLSYLKRGLDHVYDRFKEGDVINLVQFNHRVCVALQGFVVGRDKKSLYKKAVDNLDSWGSTNMHDGMTEGYSLSEKYYENSKNNRVIMITDALANTGVVNEQLSSTVTRFYDKRRISFSGVGVGHDFNDGMLNSLTEKGKGAYLFLASESAVDKVFGDKFISLLEVVARDVHFKLTMPDSLKMEIFYGEESSTRKEEVQAIHYFANSSQLFLADLEGEPATTDKIRLDIEYHTPEGGEKKMETFHWKAGSIWRDKSKTVGKARLILSFTDLIGETCPGTFQTWPCWVYPCYRKVLPIPPRPPLPPQPHPRYYPPVDNTRAMKTCGHYKKQMEKLAKGLSGDNEVQYIMDLRERYCDRFQITKVRKHGNE